VAGKEQPQPLPGGENLTQHKERRATHLAGGKGKRKRHNTRKKNEDKKKKSSSVETDEKECRRQLFKGRTCTKTIVGKKRAEPESRAPRRKGRRKVFLPLKKEEKTKKGERSAARRKGVEVDR